jgi:hypothetical protein
MQVGGAGSAAALWLSSLLNSPDAAPAGGFAMPDAASNGGQKGSAESALAGKSFPASLYGGLSADAIVSLQSDPSYEAPDAASAQPTAEEAFLKEAQKNPLERLIEQWRKQALDSMGLTEADLKGMDADRLEGIEKKIADFIQQRLKEALGTDGVAAGKDGSDTADAAGSAGALMARFG